MPVSRHSFRRVLGDLVHRYHSKQESLSSSSNDQLHSQTTHSRLRTKADRNSIISADSISVSVRRKHPHSSIDRSIAPF